MKTLILGAMTLFNLALFGVAVGGGAFSAQTCSHLDEEDEEGDEGEDPCDEGACVLSSEGEGEGEGEGEEDTSIYADHEQHMRYDSVAGFRRGFVCEH